MDLREIKSRYWTLAVGGANTWYLAREGFDVYAFDGSPSAVKKAKQYLVKEGFNTVKFNVMDGGSLKYEENFFDCVIDSACIYANRKEHIHIMYENIFRILKNGGKIYSSCFGVNTDGYGTGNFLEEGTFEDIEIGVLKGRAVAHFYTTDELTNELSRVGFDDIHVDKMNYTDNGKAVEILIAYAQK